MSIEVTLAGEPEEWCYQIQGWGNFTRELWLSKETIDLERGWAYVSKVLVVGKRLDNECCNKKG